MVMDTTKINGNIAIGDHRDLLDIIDKLRLQGVSHYIALPEIIVCGDQSAGKSSVLEAVSGMQFPIKDGLCTRFATELVLRRGHNMSTKVSITPGESRFGEDKERLKKWTPMASIDEDGLGAVTTEAEAMMAIPTGPGEFYEDTLRVELSGPEQPHLTMVDLPGLFRGGNKNQSDADISIVHDMVEGYMARPRSIILTVVSAKYEYVLQEVTLMAKKADPDGLRTMGLITKPDTLDIGSPSEHYFVRLAQNIEAELDLGWHVLKNRSYDESDITLAQRNKNEKEFLSQGLWSSIESSHCGVESLKVRLSTVLRDQILVQLPSLEQDVEDGILNCVESLERLGPVRGTSQQQRSYLLRVSENYTLLMRQAVDGTYSDRFFGNRNERASFAKRLRAVVRLRLDEFAEEMRVDGQSQHIIDSASGSEDEGLDNSHVGVSGISRSEFIGNVARRLKYNRGRELPGLFNPQIVNDLFIEQCTPWKRIAKRLADDMLDVVHFTTEKVVEQSAAKEVSEGILRLIRKEVEGLRIKMSREIDKLLVSATQHPITNNPQLVQHVQQTQEDRHKRTVKSLITKMFGTSRFDGSDKKISINPIELLRVAGQGFEPNMERFGSSLAVDYMKAFYKVAVNRFIDDVSVLAIEDCLISKLPLLFTSSSVAEMSDEMLYLLAGENEEISAERKRLELKQGILEKGLQDLKSLYKHSTVAGRREYHGLLPEDIEKVSAITQSKSEEGSSINDSGRAASEEFVEELPTSQEKHPEFQADHIKWPGQGSMKDIWSPSVTRKVVKDTSDDDHRWGS
ncbi:related to Mx2 protein (GTPase protein) [Fusarium fujikuroi]|nr:related to Mx2 protein (GTPase protein) [Fusarium fujikuroi]